jgi:hypothetical protein
LAISSCLLYRLSPLRSLVRPLRRYLTEITTIISGFFADNDTRWVALCIYKCTSF